MCRADGGKRTNPSERVPPPRHRPMPLACGADRMRHLSRRRYRISHVWHRSGDGCGEQETLREVARQVERYASGLCCANAPSNPTIRQARPLEGGSQGASPPVGARPDVRRSAIHLAGVPPRLSPSAVDSGPPTPMGFRSRQPRSESRCPGCLLPAIAAERTRYGRRSLEWTYVFRSLTFRAIDSLVGNPLSFSEVFECRALDRRHVEKQVVSRGGSDKPETTVSLLRYGSFGHGGSLLQTFAMR